MAFCNYKVMPNPCAPFLEILYAYQGSADLLPFLLSCFASCASSTVFHLGFGQDVISKSITIFIRL